MNFRSPSSHTSDLLLSILQICSSDITDELSEEDDALRKRGRRQVKKEEFGFEIALGAMEFSVRCDPAKLQIGPSLLSIKSLDGKKKIERFKAAAASNFGSGWTWLAYKANRLDVANAINPLPTEEDKKLVIVKTPNAVNPLVWDYSPLLAIDTWENRRAEYINIFMEKLVSWETVSTRLESAMARAAQREQEGTYTEDEENSEDEEPEVYLDSDVDVSVVD
uniref:Manganese/iron superoxide dismutase C-terminal domain-containing protein n=1 Tax=Brassica campestris TaxID=3711 RepID=M4F3S4_BRACM